MTVKELHEQMLAHIKSDEEFQVKVDDKLTKILDNHLSHMETDLAVLTSRTSTLWSISKGIGALVLTSIVGAILKLILIH